MTSYAHWGLGGGSGQNTCIGLEYFDLVATGGICVSLTYLALQPLSNLPLTLGHWVKFQGHFDTLPLEPYLLNSFVKTLSNFT